MRFCYPLISAVLLLFSSGFAGAQVKGDLIEQSLGLKTPFTILQYSTKQGLPQNQVVDIAAKKNGNLIVSTANGVVEYNGFEFRHFIGSDEYKQHIIGKLMWHEPSGQLFGQQTDGYLRLLHPVDKVIGRFVTQLKDHHIVVADPYGQIARLAVNDPHLKRKEIGDSHVKNPIFIYQHQNLYYLGTLEGLFCFDPLTKITTRLLNGKFLGMTVDPYTQQLYAIGSTAIYHMGAQPQVFFALNNSLSQCQQMAFVETGEIYIATSEGLYEKNGEQLRLFNKKNILPSQHIQSLYYNQADRCLYAGSLEKGLLRLQFKSCLSYSSAQGFPENCPVSAMVKTSAGELLAGGPQGYIFKLQRDTLYRFTDTQLIQGCMAEMDHKLYIGTWGHGIYTLENNRVSGPLLIGKYGTTSNFIHSIFKDSKGFYWVGSAIGLLRGTSMQNIQPWLRDSIHRDVISIYELRDGRICICGTQGIFILNRQHLVEKHLGSANGMKGKEVRGFYEGSNGRLWIGTYDGGIYCYENNRFTSMNRQKNAMLDADAFCFAPDGLGYLYITSNHGLWRIKEKDLNDFYDKKIPYLVPFYYSEEDGILNTEFNGGFQNNYLKTDARLFFPNLQGVVAVVPDQPVERKLKPVIDRIFVNDTLVRSLENPLSRNTSSIRFEFSSNSFLGKYNVYYQYKITRNAESGEWSPLQKSGFVNFNSLPHGQYTFSIRAIDAFNDRAPSEVQCTFRILPYFYETTWFVVILGLVFLLLTVFIGRMRIQMYRRKAEEKERNKRRLAELELKAVHDRMNPHFVFNSLNSIKYYLSIDDKEKANQYLDGFSILLRKFTEYSSQNFISVREEMDIISTYVRLEQMRMNNAFETHISIDPQSMGKFIPTINIQPFVENAIKHGIAHSVRPCVLSITITTETDYLIKCVIEDNGIGRKRSQEINAGRRHHVSSGIKLVEEKKQIISALYNIGISIDITDKTDAAGQPAGTIVTLLIPVKHD